MLVKNIIPRRGDLTHDRDRELFHHHVCEHVDVLIHCDYNRNPCVKLV